MFEDASTTVAYQHILPRLSMPSRRRLCLIRAVNSVKLLGGATLGLRFMLFNGKSLTGPSLSWSRPVPLSGNSQTVLRRSLRIEYTY